MGAGPPGRPSIRRRSLQPWWLPSLLEQGWLAVVIYLALGSLVTRLGFRTKQARGLAEARGGLRGPENVWGSAATGALLAGAAALAPAAAETALNQQQARSARQTPPPHTHTHLFLRRAGRSGVSQAPQSSRTYTVSNARPSA